MTDILSDGLAFDTGFTPTVTVLEGGGSLGSGTFDPANFSVVRDPVTGRTTVVFALGPQLIANGADDILDGTLPGQTTVRITYRANVEMDYQAQNPPGDGTLSQGDTLLNEVVAGGGVLDGNGDPTGGTVTDHSHATAGIGTSSFDKTVYAKNGELVAPGTLVTVSSNDLITFRLRIALPQTLSTELRVEDFLPLPTFDLTGVSFTFVDVVGAVPPAANVVSWGPDAGAFDAAIGTNPTIAINAAANSVTFSFGALRPSSAVASVADLLFTVKAVDAPFGDGLVFRNLGTMTEIDSNGRPITQSGTEEVLLAEPALNLTRGVVGVITGQTEFSTSFTAPVGPVPFAPPGSTGAPFSGLIDSAALDATPIDADLTGVDAGDLVRFVITLENTGSGPKGAHDILIRDTLPAGFVIPPGGSI